MLRDVQESAVRGAIALKESACRRGPRDIRAFIDVFRGNDLVAMVLPSQHDRELILAIFRAAAGGFDGDALGLTIESYTTPPMNVDGPVADVINPLTGRPWEQGEMNDAVKHHDALAKGWVVEALSITCANRAGDLTMMSLPYRYAGRHLVWLDPQVLPSEGHAEGVIPDAMIAAMNEPSVSVIAPLLPVERSREDRDRLCAKVMLEHFPCSVVLMSQMPPDRQRDRVRLLRAAGVPYC
jgi:hypothetical protein